MDRFDIALLNALQEDGRLTNYELADRVGLSASQCSRRRAALEEARVISSYHARLSEEALGLDILVFIQVTLATHSPNNSQQFHKLINSLPEVQEAYSLTGEADYLVRLTVPDLKSLSRILNDVLLPHGSVAHVRSSIVLDRVKRTMSLPLSHLAGSKTDATVARPHGATAASDEPNRARRGSLLKSTVTKRRK
jgi:DNA-binding Lrp family transcriptional regulator